MKSLQRWNVRDSHQSKLSSLSEQQGSKKWKEKEWFSEPVMPLLQEAVSGKIPVFRSRPGQKGSDIAAFRKEVEIDCYCTDHWKAFAQVLPPNKHKIGKAYTKNIEGVNTSIRTRNRRFVRKTTCFSKKKENHIASLNIMFNYRNKQKAKHHTF